MEEKKYKIKIRRGHSDKLCFWLDPLSQEILDGDADLIEEDELSCDNKCMHRLVGPFLRQYYPGKIRWKNELNLIPMKNVRMLEKEREFGSHTPVILEQDTKKVCDLTVPVRNMQIREGMFFYIY